MRFEYAYLGQKNAKDSTPLLQIHRCLFFQLSMKVQCIYVDELFDGK